MAIDVVDFQGNIIHQLSTWQCGLCSRLFIDGDIHDEKEVKRLCRQTSRPPIAICDRWCGNQPVCEACGITRNIPKDE